MPSQPRPAAGDDAAPELDDRSPRPSLSRRHRVVRAAVALLFVAALVAVAVPERHEVAAAVRGLSWPTVVLALVAVTAGNVCNSLSWRAILSGLGSTLPVPSAARVFLLAQLGKYLPGSVWPLLAQVELGRDHGVSRARSGVAAVAALVVGVVAGGVVAVLGLALSRQDLVGDYWLIWLVIPLGVLVLAPPVLERLLQLAMRVARRRGQVPRLGSRALLTSAAWSVLMWFAFGVQAWLLLRGVAGAAPHLFLLALGGYAAAWLVGFVVVVAPAGAGAREAAFVVLLSPPLTSGDALAIALVSRMLMLAGDALCAGGAVLSARAHERRLAARR